MLANISTTTAFLMLDMILLIYDAEIEIAAHHDFREGDPKNGSIRLFILTYIYIYAHTYYLFNNDCVIGAWPVAIYGWEGLGVGGWVANG